jgi:hypothetical protein
MVPPVCFWLGGGKVKTESVARESPEAIENKSFMCDATKCEHHRAVRSAVNLHEPGV